MTRWGSARRVALERGEELRRGCQFEGVLASSVRILEILTSLLVRTGDEQRERNKGERVVIELLLSA